MFKPLISIIAATTMLSVTTPSFANDSEILARMEALSYAPKGADIEDERFSQFDLDTQEYAEHELNDSWLGMPAYSSDGKLIGYIEDAYLDVDGYAEEIIVGLNDDKGFIEIEGKFALLDEEKVQFNLSQTQIAALAGENKLVSLVE